MSGEIVECPICGGRIQATMKAWLDNIVLNEDFSVKDRGEITGFDDDYVVYCENDHYRSEMEQYLYTKEKS